MCDSHQPGLSCSETAATSGADPVLSRRGVLGAMAASAAAVTATNLLGRVPSAQAAPSRSTGLDLTLLGTLGGPPPVAGRFGISTALVVNGKTYVIDCGRGAVSQYLRAGLSMPSLSGIFLTHLHADHTVDTFSFPLLAGGIPGKQGFQSPIDVFGPGPSGYESLISSAPGPVPGTVGMMALANQTFAEHSTFFLAEHIGIDPSTMYRAHDVMPPASAGASLNDKAPTSMTPFTVMENDDIVVTAILVPHGAVYPAYAYRFDTDHGSVVFSGDTAPTPNIPRLAQDADVLVHEAVDMDSLPALGYPPAGIEHIRTVHTDVKLLGGIAAASNVKTLVASHLVPGDLDIVSQARWRRLLHDSGRQAHFRGDMIAGSDLMQLSVGRALQRG